MQPPIYQQNSGCLEARRTRGATARTGYHRGQRTPRPHSQVPLGRDQTMGSDRWPTLPGILNRWPGQKSRQAKLQGRGRSSPFLVPRVPAHHPEEAPRRFRDGKRQRHSLLACRWRTDVPEDPAGSCRPGCGIRGKRQRPQVQNLLARGRRHFRGWCISG